MTEQLVYSLLAFIINHLKQDTGNLISSAYHLSGLMSSIQQVFPKTCKKNSPLVPQKNKKCFSKEWIGTGLSELHENSAASIHYYPLQYNKKCVDKQVNKLKNKETKQVNSVAFVKCMVT